jgi:hypothetical protein
MHGFRSMKRASQRKLKSQISLRKVTPPQTCLKFLPTPTTSVLTEWERDQRDPVLHIWIWANMRSRKYMALKLGVSPKSPFFYSLTSLFRNKYLRHVFMWIVILYPAQMFSWLQHIPDRLPDTMNEIRSPTIHSGVCFCLAALYKLPWLELR